MHVFVCTFFFRTTDMNSCLGQFQKHIRTITSVWDRIYFVYALQNTYNDSQLRVSSDD